RGKCSVFSALCSDRKGIGTGVLRCVPCSDRKERKTGTVMETYRSLSTLFPSDRTLNTRATGAQNTFFACFFLQGA
ncbi:MAG: hypothetical protein CO090_00580, partial [Acidobacteria bacterium CG_4_9_14_3_um_filter_49_7]